ncbi:ABC transporter ATP-binding protein [Pseudomonas sp. BP8]|uniref:ABC transporter ATP-binding protein n=1 Tax=Pseudomonas sp. BP8 TaxID=2817864 RepID=UPI001AE1F01D|nr:ABC transporter ATP-binding protein [Pseudomonas sp. BP8]MBP2263285.1 ABC-2 type transport system ATP-binding protein [Pseudomonas sp. BP8]HDS1735269.1 ABC transporter ATP-binding protein [Pseudomonas putida]
MIDTPAPLEACGLTRQFKAYKALDEVSLRVEAGTVLGLLGRNGAGKSTLIECLLGLQRPDAGQARIFAKPATGLDDADKMQLAYVPQRLDTLEWLKIGPWLELFARLYPTWDAHLVERLLVRWALDRKQTINRLSPGQRQQLAIIRALASRPRLLVLDEPAAALDPTARRELLQEIVELSGEHGGTVVFSTHILSDLERVASHVALLHGGRLRLQGELDSLKENLRRLHWPAAQPLPAEPLPGEKARRLLSSGGWTLVIDPAQCPLPLPSTPQPLSLEDLFVELTA